MEKHSIKKTSHPFTPMKGIHMSKSILITGASSGFGRDTAETLALAGHRVFATMRDINGRNRTHTEALKAKGIHVEELDVISDTQ
jgi:NADP-dependent 3-hydroxy acid dehydrogenase YdfG